MYSASNTASSPIFITHEKKFLIVPIFFRKQIERFIESTDSAGIGFIFGDEQDNFSIIKKVWTVENNESSASVELLNRAKEMASSSGMVLLGMFYNNASLSIDHTNTFPTSEDLTSVELVIENGITKEWVPHNTQNYAGTIIEQKIIL